MSRLVVPAFDFGICVAVMIVGTSGLKWLSSESHAIAYSDSQLQISKDELEDQLSAGDKRREGLGRQWDASHQKAEGLQNELDKARAIAPDLGAVQASQDQAERDLERARDEMARLDEELRRLLALQEKLQQEERLSEEVQEKIEEQKKKLKERLTANQGLKDDIALIEAEKIPEQMVQIDATPVVQTETNRNRVFVVLTKSKVTPVKEPFYEIVHFPNGQQMTLVRPGETVDRALAKGSAFMTLVDAINPRRQYIYLLVDSSSAETFRTVRKALRHRNIPFGWEPKNVTTIVLSADGRETTTTK